MLRSKVEPFAFASTARHALLFFFQKAARAPLQRDRKREKRSSCHQSSTTSVSEDDARRLRPPLAPLALSQLSLSLSLNRPFSCPGEEQK